MVGPIDWPELFTIGPRCDECSSRMMLEHLEFRGNTWKCYTCYTCMIIVSSVTMVVSYHGGKGMKGERHVQGHTSRAMATTGARA